MTTIGLEVHCQLDTRTKIFCGCAVEFGSAPNSRVCPVCLGLPGALPVLNKKVFELGLRAVLATGGDPSRTIRFDRKNYFYPDLPKGYQISQYGAPLGLGGSVEIESGGVSKKVRLNRIHLEEDAGKLLHDQDPDSSHVDLNRAGTPLIEIVSEPDLESAEEAYEYLVNLKALLKAIGVSQCDMEKGQLRCDANVSVRKKAADALGRRVEIKNLNSFKAVKSAIEHEIGRQAAVMEKGERVAQETRLWDDAGQKTVVMRSKEEAHDYRYFPEPDLVPFFVTEQDVASESGRMPELPKARRERYVRELGLSPYDAKVLMQNEDLVRLFEECLKTYKNAKTVANWLTGPVSAYLNQTGKELGRTALSAERLLGMIKLVEEGTVSLQAAKDRIFPDVIETGREPERVMEEKGLKQVSDEGSLEAWASEVIDANPKVVADFKSGKESAAMFLVGQVMKKSAGKANPGKVKDLLLQKLKAR